MEFDFVLDNRMDEFQVVVDDGMITCASWCVATKLPNVKFCNHVSSTGRIKVKASRDEAIRLLMLCRYPNTAMECSIVRRSENDNERRDHKEYFSKVKAYVDMLWRESEPSEEREKGEVSYSTIKMKRWLDSAHKMFEAKNIWQITDVWDDFIIAKSYPADDPVFNKLKSVLVKNAILSQSQLDEMMKKCVVE